MRYGSIEAAPAPAPRRPRGAALAAAALVLVGVAGLARRGAAPALLVSTDGDDDGFETKTVYPMDLANRFPSIRKSLVDAGCRVGDANCYAGWLPTLEFRWRSDRLVDDGWTVTAFNHYQTTATAGTLLLVYNARGVIRAAKMIGSGDDLPGLSALPIKPVAPGVFLVMTNQGRTKAGPQFLWTPADDSFDLANAGARLDAHAFSLAPRDDAADTFTRAYALHTEGDDDVDASQGLGRFDLYTGVEDERTPRVTSGADYANHLQCVAEGCVVGMKDLSKAVGAFFLVKDGEVAWRAGGERSDFALFDADGAQAGADTGYSLWSKAHGLEYFGDDEYAVFANARSPDDTRGSRALVLRADTDARTLAVAWELELPYADVFGDVDLLPGGNVLTNHWPPTSGAGAARADAADYGYDARVLEVVRASGAVAAELRAVNGLGAPRFAGALSGWANYAQERFYDAPAVANANCDGGALAFDAWDVFKMDAAYAGTFAVADAAGAPVLSGTFEFARFWRTTRVDVPTDLDLDGATLVVEDAWGLASAPLVLDCGP